MNREKVYYPTGNTILRIRESEPEIVDHNGRIVRKGKSAISYKVQKVSTITSKSEITNAIVAITAKNVAATINANYGKEEVTAGEVEAALDKALIHPIQPIWDKETCIKKIKGEEFGKAQKTIDILQEEVEELRQFRQSVLQNKK